MPGVHVDGHAFAARAVEQGAVAIVVERELAGLDVPQLVVDRTRRALADAADAWYGHPSERLQVIGITGTDGKTTSSFLAVELLRAGGMRPGMIGTVAADVGDERRRLRHLGLHHDRRGVERGHPHLAAELVDRRVHVDRHAVVERQDVVEVLVREQERPRERRQLRRPVGDQHVLRGRSLHAGAELLDRRLDARHLRLGRLAARCRRDDLRGALLAARVGCEPGADDATDLVVVERDLGHAALRARRQTRTS